MIKRRSKFWTVIFSFLPGAGHMFMGFMKQGVSYMSMFFFVIFMAAWLNISPLLFVLPILWFYSFFDAINKMSLADEDFYQQEDYFVMNGLFSLDNEFMQKRKLFFGIGLVIIGAYLLWDSFFINISYYLPDFVRHIIYGIRNVVPQLILGIIIIIAGIKLISGQKRESDVNDQNP